MTKPVDAFTAVPQPALGTLSRVLRWTGSAGALPWAVFAMESAWFYLWMVLLGRWSGFGINEVPLAPGSIMFLLLASFYGVQVLGQQQWSPGKVRLWAGGLVVVALAMVARLENGGGYGLLDGKWLGFALDSLAGSFPTGLQTSLVGGAYLWWRGYKLARDGLDQESVLRAFKVGLIALVLALLLWEAAVRAETMFPVSRYVASVAAMAFFSFGTLALALSHITQVRAEMARYEGVDQSFTVFWPLLVLGLVATMLVASWVMAGVLSIDVWARVLHWLALAANLLALLVYYLLLPVALLAAGLVYAAQWLISLLGNSTPPIFTIPDMSAFRRLQETEEAVREVPLWVVVLKWGLLMLLISAAVYVLARLVLARRWRPAGGESVPEIQESVGSWRSLVRDLITWLFAIMFWIRDKATPIHRGLRILRGRPSDEYGEGLGVRELYRILLQEARAAGFPREDSETPYDYLPTLKRHLSPEADALERLTHGYVATRYGERPLTEEEKGLLNRLWQGVLKRLKTPDGSSADAQ